VAGCECAVTCNLPDALRGSYTVKRHQIHKGGPMAETIGTVQCVRVAADSAFTCLTEQGSTTNELFILWWDGISTPANPPASVRIIQSDWIALLRQALASNVPVAIGHDDNSALALTVQLGQGGP
jgi:hypothetical protein